MKKRDWFWIIFALALTIGFDQVTKQWASASLTHVKFYGIFGLALHHNPGIMLGMFSDLPPILRVVSLSTGGAFLLFCFVVIQYLLPIKSMTLRLGLSILIGGILGNVIDRILYGYVIDFLVLGNRTISTGIFNFADALQWVAYFMIVYALFKESEVLWPVNNRRGRLWVKPKFQLKYCIILISAGLAFSLISGVFSYTFLRVTLTEPQQNFNSIQKILSTFSVTFVIISLTFAIFMFIVGLRLSHKTAGPLYAFEKYLKDLSAGEKRKFRLRVGDEFPELETISAHIMKELEKIREPLLRSNSQDNQDNQETDHSSTEENSIDEAQLSLLDSEESTPTSHQETDSEPESQPNSSSLRST